MFNLEEIKKPKQTTQGYWSTIIIRNKERLWVSFPLIFCPIVEQWGDVSTTWVYQTIGVKAPKEWKVLESKYKTAVQTPMN